MARHELEGMLRPGIHLRCPKCAAMMDRVEMEKFCVDRCTACGGFWLDSSELQQVGVRKGAAEKLDAGSKGPAERGRGSMLCPRDQSPLVAKRDEKQSHVVVDQCRQCLGMFLDAGELKDLASHTLAEKLKGFFGG